MINKNWCPGCVGWGVRTVCEQLESPKSPVNPKEKEKKREGEKVNQSAQPPTVSPSLGINPGYWEITTMMVLQTKQK